MSNPGDRREISLIKSQSPRGGRSIEEARNLRRASESAGGQAGAERSGDPSLGVPGGFRDGYGGQSRRENEEIQSPLGDGAKILEEAGQPLLALPQRRRATSRGGLVSFCLCVILPVIAAAIYYIGFASNQYVVEWRFTIRSADTATSTSIATSPLTAMLGATSLTNPTDSYMVTEYITSEQAIIDLEKRIGLRSLYSLPSIDYWSRIDGSLPIERFARYWKRMITASYDQITGTGIAEVRAFTAADAYLIAQTLVTLSDELINETSQRPLMEAVRYAEIEVARAQNRLRNIRSELTDYRNRASVIDPNSSVVLSNATVASTLRQTIAQYQADLGAALSGGLGQNASQVEILKRRIKATQDQLKDIESDIARVRDGNQPLSGIVGRYEELDLERQFGQSLLTSTMQSLEQARANALARRLFIVPYVKPVVPQSSVYPRRAVAIATVAGACILIWTIGLLLFRSIREHLA